ncbi:MAG: hypothetical protein ACRDBG_06135 [Waterburya sp.]
MSICLVKNPKSYLILARYIDPEYNSRGKLIKPGYWRRFQTRDRIPYEVEDIRFRRAVLAVDCGWKLYPDTKLPLAQVRPIEISDALLEDCKREYESDPFRDEFTLNTRGFFSKSIVNKPLTKREMQINRQKEIDAVKTAAWDKIKDEMLAKYPDLLNF